MAQTHSIRVIFILLFLGLSIINAQCVQQVNAVSRSDGFPDILLYINGLYDRSYAIKVEYVMCDSIDTLVYRGNGSCLLIGSEHILVFNDINIAHIRVPVLPGHDYDLYISALGITTSGSDTTIRYHFYYKIENVEEWICKELLIDTVVVDTLDTLPSFSSSH